MLTFPNVDVIFNSTYYDLLVIEAKENLGDFILALKLKLQKAFVNKSNLVAVFNQNLNSISLPNYY